MNSLKKLEHEIFACDKCPRLCQVTPIPYPHIFYKDPNQVKYVVIGRNPGLEYDYSKVSTIEFMDVYHKQFWNCRLGQYLRQILGDDITRTLFFTNICKCSSPKNSLLQITEIENCRHWLELQINIIKPQKIITFGAQAATWFNQRTTLFYAFGKSFSWHKYTVIPLYHPSYLSSHSKNDIVQKQTKILKDILQ